MCKEPFVYDDTREATIK